MQKINAWVYRYLHLVPHDQIFIIQLVIRAIVKCPRQKPHHIILIEIHVTDITLVILIIDKIHAGITVRNFLHLITPLPKAPCNFAVLPPVPNRYKYAILLNIYDKRSDCKGVPEMKIIRKKPRMLQQIADSGPIAVNERFTRQTLVPSFSILQTHVV